MDELLATRGRPAPPPPIALVMNVEDRRGVELVRSLARAGVGVAVHFTVHRQAIDLLVEEIWDQGGRIRAFDGRDPKGARLATLLQKIQAISGDVPVVIDASHPAHGR